MTWKSTPLAILFAALAALPAPSAAQEVVFPQTTPVDLDPANPNNLELGELTYRGGVEIEAGEENIGGISGLDWADGQLYAVTDDGRWLVMTTSGFRDKLTDVVEIEMGPLFDERGKRLRRKEDADAEAIARTAEGQWLVAFERDHRIWRYPALDQPAEPVGLEIDDLLAAAQANGGLETLATTPDGWLACAERAPASVPNCKRSGNGGLEQVSIPTPAPLDQLGGVPTDADCASNGVCFVLFRSYVPGTGNGAAIVAIGPDGLSEVLAVWDTALTIDNFEGLAVREEGGKAYLYIVSDNNFSRDQRTLLMKFEVSQRAATTPGVPEKAYATVDIVLVTELGEITVALETERAPITAANFLRYIDEDRYDDTRCYRAMRVEGSAEPAGFLQCGTQNHPDRILPSIAHEPTNETGLSHKDGALSMARFEPGTATGDFSIMIQDQRGLDAFPESDDPDRRPGFAVFGYVTSGMDVVHAIHAEPLDPDAGEGFLKGQMLATPIRILDVRRAEPPE